MNFKPESIKSLLLEIRFNGTLLSTGTGFLVGNSTLTKFFLITNRHNLTGLNQETGKPLSPTGGIPNEIIINHSAISPLYDPSRGFYLDANSSPHSVKHLEKLYEDEDMEIPIWIEHPLLKNRADFVALELTQKAGVIPIPYNLYKEIDSLDGVSKTSIKVGPADSVSVIGFPFGLSVKTNFAIWATGFIASEPDIDYDDLPIFLIDCRSRPGQSGSPVISHKPAGQLISMENGTLIAFQNETSKFLGIYSGRINEKSDLGFVWKEKAIRELIDSIQA